MAHGLRRASLRAVGELQAHLLLELVTDVGHLQQRNVCRRDDDHAVSPLLRRHRCSAPLHEGMGLRQLRHCLRSEGVLSGQDVHDDTSRRGVVDAYNAAMPSVRPPCDDDRRAGRRRGAEALEHGAEGDAGGVLHGHVRVRGVSLEPKHADVGGAKLEGARQRQHHHRDDPQSRSLDLSQDSFPLEVVAAGLLRCAEEPMAVAQAPELSLGRRDEGVAGLQIRPHRLEKFELQPAGQRREQLGGPRKTFGQGLADAPVEGLGPGLVLRHPLHQHPSPRLRDRVLHLGDVAAHGPQLRSPRPLEPHVAPQEQREHCGRDWRCRHEGLSLHGGLQLRRQQGALVLPRRRGHLRIDLLRDLLKDLNAFPDLVAVR
mmetsp:Transcript_102634/g.257256  ORF Transcript_102634/g.257256 Transcript_102634/m.257256 type:complete len:372 (-) Transcript_102634:188-1303(-)